MNPLLWCGKKHLAKLKYVKDDRGNGQLTLPKRISPPGVLVWIQVEEVIISVGVSDEEVFVFNKHVVEDRGKLDEHGAAISRITRHFKLLAYGTVPYGIVPY